MGAIVSDLANEVKILIVSIFGALPYLLGYVALILLFMLIWRFVRKQLTPAHDYTSLKTVTFGDESAVKSDTAASVISVVLIFVIWGAFTGSGWLPSPFHAPGPFVGEGQFVYTVEAADGTQSDATVFVTVFEKGETVPDA